jgi:hypothetical protein
MDQRREPTRRRFISRRGVEGEIVDYSDVGGSGDTSNMSSNDTVRNVQVPVSLIERARLVAELKGSSAVRDELDALLSQPAPTAEPCTCSPPATHLGEGPDQDCPTRGDRFRVAEPPRIEDMAPGTTFTAEGEGVPGTEHRFTVTGERNRHGVPVLSCSIHRTGALANYVARSTIRDVTPPKEDR